MTLPTDPIRVLAPSPAQARLLAIVRAQLALPGAPIAATACYVSSYYDDNRTHKEKVFASGVGPKGSKAKITPLLRQALHDAAYAFGDNGWAEGSEDILLVLPGATILLHEHGGQAALSAVVVDPDADPARGFHGFAHPPLPAPVHAWMAAHAPAHAAGEDGSAMFLTLRHDAKTWAQMSGHHRLEHYRAIQSDAAVAAWIDAQGGEGAIVLERAGAVAVVSQITDEWSGDPERHPIALVAL